MTPAVALAACAGAAGAAAIVEGSLAWVAARSGRSPQRGRWVVALARLGRRLGAPTAPRDLAGRIEAAGSPLGLGLADVMAAKWGAAAVALALGSPLAAVAPGRLPLLAFATLPVAGFLMPDLALRRRTRARARTIAVQLPALLDLLRVAVVAGLPLSRALSEAGSRHRGLLGAEWRAAAAELELGVPREQALRQLASRCPHPAIAALVAAIGRSQRHGAPLARTLAALAAEARAERARAVRERAARAAPKIQLVVALALVPSAMLLVAAALTDALL